MKRKLRDLGADYIDPFEIETTFSAQYSSQLHSKEQEKGGGGIAGKPFQMLGCGPSCKTLKPNKQALASQE